MEQVTRDESGEETQNGEAYDLPWATLWKRLLARPSSRECWAGNILKVHQRENPKSMTFVSSFKQDRLLDFFAPLLNKLSHAVRVIARSAKPDEIKRRVPAVGTHELVF